MKSGSIHSMDNQINTLFRSSTQAMEVYDGYQYCSNNIIRSRGAKSSQKK